MIAPTTPGIAPSQTVGPFFANCLLRPDAIRTVLAGPNTAGERIRIAGRVLDGDGLGVPDALVEIWQANSYGRYNHPDDTRDLPLEPDFLGFGRAGTNEEGGFRFETVVPGPVPLHLDDERMQAPHISVIVFSRGLLNHLVTRLYFADRLSADDPVLARVPAERRGTLLSQPTGDGLYRWDIVLQGPNETVFFNL